MTKIGTARRSLLFLAALIGVTAACGQSTSKISVSQSTSSGSLDFEVATIRQIKTGGGWKMNFTPDGFVAERVALRQVIYEAYGVYQDDRWSGGPAWLNSEKFDIRAKLDVEDVPQFADLSLEQRRAMLQHLLAARCGLVVHEETKELPVYDLVVAKNGPKLHASPADHLYRWNVNGTAGLVTRSSSGLLEVQGYSMTGYAQLLTMYVGRTVEDKTGIAGRYDLALHWTPDDAPRGMNAPDTTEAPDASGPSLFTALQEQLGLKLQPAKAPLVVHVIEHVEQPTAN